MAISSTRGAFRAVAIVLGVVVLTAGIAWLGYGDFIERRQAYLAQRNFRALAVIAEQLEARVRAIRGVWANQKPEPGTVSCPGPVAEAPRLIDCATEQPDIGQTPGAGAAAGVQMYLESGRAPRPVLLLGVTSADDPHGDPNACHYHDDTRTCSSACRDEPPCWEGTCWARLALDELVAEVTATLDIFDDLMLTTEDGIVVVHRGSLPAPAFDLDQLLAAPAGGQSPATGSEAAGPRDGAGHGTGSLDGSPLVAGAIRRVRVRDVDHLLFAQPLGLSVRHGPDGTGTAVSTRLVLNGLVRSARFAAESRHIPYRWVVRLVVGLLLVSLMWPLLKLRFAGPRERVTGVDVRVLALGLVAAAGIATASVYSAYADRELGARSDAQLAQIAAAVDERLHRLLVNAHWTLRALADQDRPPESPVAFDEARIVRLTEVDPNGMTNRRWNWIAESRHFGRDKRSRPLDVSNRSYLKDIASDNVWHVLPGITLATERVRSKLDGSDALLVAMPETASRPSRILVAVCEPRAFNRPVLPLGVGFAIIEGDGTVNLHSDQTRDLVERLFEELDEPEPLRAAVTAARDGLTDGHAREEWVRTVYGGREQLMYVRAIAGTPWTVLAFRDDGPLQTVSAEALARWAMLFSTYLAAWLGVLGVMQLVQPRYRAEWLWPDSRVAGGTYLVAAARLAGVALLTAVLATHARASGELALIFLVPALALARAFGDLTRARPDIGSLAERRAARLVTVVGLTLLACMTLPGETGSTTIGTGLLLLLLGVPAPTIRSHRPTVPAAIRLQYAVFLLGLLASAGAAPAFALFADAKTEVHDEFAQHAQREFAAAKQRRDQRLRFEQQQQSQTQGPAWLAERLAATSDIYDVGSVAQDGVAGSAIEAPPPPERRLAAWVATLLPASSELAASLRLVPGPVPRFSRALLLASILVVAGLLVLGAFAMLWALVSKLFLFEADRDGLEWAATATEGEPDIVCVFRKPAGTGLAPAGSASGCAIDLRRGSTPDDLASWWKANAHRAHLELHHLEARLDDARWHEAILEAVAEAVFDPERSVVVTSAIDPIPYLEARAGGVPPDGDQKPAAGQGERRTPMAGDPLRRWRLVLSGLSLSRVTVAPGDAATATEPTATALSRWYSPAPVGESAAARDGRYRETWARSTTPERLVMRQLAEEGFLSPASAPLVRGLMQRGLIRRNPALRLVSRSFEDFVLRAEPPDVITAWEREGERSPWENISRLLLIVVLLAAVFVFATQRELFNSSVAVVTALGGVLPIVLRILGTLGGDGSATASK